MFVLTILEKKKNKETRKRFSQGSETVLQQMENYEKPTV